MKCARCGSDNRAGRRFCGACGAPLQSPCPSCGFANEARRALLRRLRQEPRRTAAGVPARLHAEAPRGADPHLASCHGRGAEAGQRPLLRPRGLLPVRRDARAGDDARDHGPRPAAHGRGRPPLRGHREPVPRRRAHGAVRRSHRARGSRAPRRARGARHPGHRHRLRPGARPRAGRRASLADRHQHGAGRRGTDRRRPAHGLHRRRRHHAPGGAAAGPRRAGRCARVRVHVSRGGRLRPGRRAGARAHQGPRRAGTRLQRHGPARAAEPPGGPHRARTVAAGRTSGRN